MFSTTNVSDERNVQGFERMLSYEQYPENKSRLWPSSFKKIGLQCVCVAYEIELLFSVWCLTGFLLEELISDYHSIVFNIDPVHQ